MRKAALFFLCIIFLSSCGKDKETNQPQVTSYAEQVLARKKDNPPPPKVDNSEQEKKESYMEAPLMPAKVVVMPMACVNGSYAPGNYQNRHYFPALVNTLLEMYGNIRTPRRSAVIDAALEKKLIAPNFQARRRKTYNLIETANFGNEIKAELLVIPSLYGNDDGNYRYKIQIIEPSKGVAVLWETECATQTVKLNFLATLPLYEESAFKTAQYLLSKENTAAPFLSKSDGTQEAQDLLKKAIEIQKSLTIPAQMEAINIIYQALRADPNFTDAWIALSKSYSILALNLYGSTTQAGDEMSLRSLIASTIARRLDPENPGLAKAALHSAGVNKSPHEINKWKKAFVSQRPDDPLAKYLSLEKDTPAAQLDALKLMVKSPEDFVYFIQSVPAKDASSLMNELVESNPESTLIYHKLYSVFLDLDFTESRRFALVHTYLAQKQFLQKWLDLLQKRDSNQSKESVDNCFKKLESLANNNEKKSEDINERLNAIFDTLQPQYGNAQAYQFRLNCIPLKVLKICREVHKSALAEINADSADAPHFYDSVNLTERDAVILGQRELLCGPLANLYIIGTSWYVLETVKEVMPALEKLFPRDMLVYDTCFWVLYKSTGDGPTGTAYLKKMYAIDQSNLNVLRYQLDNYISKGGSAPDLMRAMYNHISIDPGNENVVSRSYKDAFKIEEIELARDILNYFLYLYPADINAIAYNFHIKKYQEKRFITPEEIENVFGKTPTGFTKISLAAFTYRANGYWDKALELYKQAFEMSPDDDDLAYELGLTYRLVGQPEKYVETLEKCAQKIGPTLSSAFLFQNIGWYYFFQGEFEKAKIYYLKSDMIDSWQGGSILGRAYIAYAEGNTQLCFEELEASFKRYHHAYPVELKAKILLKQYRPQEAKDYILKTLLDPEFILPIEAHLAMYESMYRLGQKESALDNFIGYKKIFPTHITPQLDTARMCLRMGQEQKGIAELEEWLKVKKYGVWELQPIYLAMVECYLQLGNFSAAEPYLEKCKLFMPFNENTLSMLGRVAFEKGEIEEARKWTELALRVSPALTSAAATNVLIELKEGNADEAISWGEIGMKRCIFDDDTRLYAALARAYAKKGEVDKAKSLVDKIILIDGAGSYWAKKASE
ncbi:MAG: Tetratricopeptide repeat protein [candidate division BRC1 bacterium ADurb.Bin183]|nr:MAG: Tetratricopeptide repeat protein [candidate division BRC1 bacterium ADurb.Bin183]